MLPETRAQELPRPFLPWHGPSLVVSSSPTTSDCTQVHAVKFSTTSLKILTQYFFVAFNCHVEKHVARSQALARHEAEARMHLGSITYVGR
jgi:hypothetical protein